MIYVELEDTLKQEVVFRGSNKEAIAFLDISVSTLSNAHSKGRLIKKRYKIITYKTIKQSKIPEAIQREVLKAYREGSTIRELAKDFNYTTHTIVENFKLIPNFNQKYGHVTIDYHLKAQVKEAFETMSLTDLCKKFRITRKQVIAIIDEKPMPVFEKVSRQNILRRAFHQSCDPEIVIKRIKNTSRFRLWDYSDDDLKNDTYHFYSSIKQNQK